MDPLQELKSCHPIFFFLIASTHFKKVFFFSSVLKSIFVEEH